MKMILAMVLFSVLVGCDQGPVTTVNSSKITQVGLSLELRTVEHDGHKFVVVWTGASQGGCSMSHHPGCQCLKSEVK